jgi:molybdopterin-containing oxidoreductase family iron-sulfur binding subunit
MSENKADTGALEAPTHWTSLEELARTPEFEAFASAEFPTAWEEARHSEAGRRDFLKLMGASLGLAGLSNACVRQPDEKIVPYVKMPEEIVPGKPLEFASAVERGGYGTGVLVETHMYRPTHLRGNPEHPDSRGGLHPQAQAGVLDVWDPDRSRQIRRRGNVSTWDSFVREMNEVIANLSEQNGAGLRFLTGQTSSPTLLRTFEAIRQRMPEARWHIWEPVSRHHMYEGARRAFGRYLEVRYRLDRASVVFDLDADFMGAMPGAIRHQAEVLRTRNDQDFDRWCRLYVAEPTPTVGGSAADHRLRIRSGEAGALLAAVARALGLEVPAPKASVDGAFATAVARDLAAAGRGAVVVVGDAQPPEVHALAHAIHAHLGAAGHAVVTTEPVLAPVVDPMQSLRELVSAMNAGEVETLIMLDRNPVYDAPADLEFGKALSKVPNRVHVGAHTDETADVSHWHIPSHSAFEMWGDVRSTDGTATIMQPTLRPLHDTHSPLAVLSIFSGENEGTDYDRVRKTWKERLQGDFEKIWRRALHDGIVPDTSFRVRKPELDPKVLKGAPPPGPDGLEVRFVPDPNLWDGRFATNPWLLELPQPITKLSWDNAVLVSPSTAERLGLEATDVVELRVEDRMVEAPIWVLPGMADDVATVHLGWGRRSAGPVGSGQGFDAYAVRSSQRPWITAGKLKKTDRKERLACTQDHFRMMERGLIRAATTDHYASHPQFAHAREAHLPKLTLWKPWSYEGHKWGMTINLSACNGCNACVAACQSENNIPVVGKEQVAKGREMHWIRVDRYYSGPVEDPVLTHQPVTCMMCENAPCETVCPVNATVHGPEGLNQMVYNRCVGTRYCSNNCPYKVRRFNFHLYADWYEESLKGQRNPDVTVRGRGVMEKCTYCVQRINRATIQARVEGKKRLETDSIQTACQEACPSRAISFGDLNDPDADVARKQKTPLSYALLGELNTRPRTTYLARLFHRNDELPVPTPARQTESHGDAAGKGGTHGSH